MSKTVISLFAGGGGSSLGYKMAGCQVLAAVEYDPHAAETYRNNHPDTWLLEGDITKITPKAIMAKLGLCVGELDILDGSPPCQGFSTVGKRVVTDPRNRLFEDYRRFLHALQPKAFVMENVPGMVRGKMRPIFWQIVKALEGEGYIVRARILNAAHYGVPQNRHRLIILGVRQDVGTSLYHPLPQTAPVSFRTATQSLKEHGVMLEPTGRALAIAKGLKPGESGAHLHERYRQQANDYSLSRLAWHKPSPTVCKTIRAGQAGLLHPDELRFLSIGEAKRVCSFPDDFKLHGTFEQQWGRLGNAVPPLLMKAVAISLIQQLEGVHHGTK